jgi:ferritin-like protein
VYAAHARSGKARIIGMNSSAIKAMLRAAKVTNEKQNLMLLERIKYLIIDFIICLLTFY